MAEPEQLRGMFTFPPQLAGEPSTRNWYSELLNHPDCQGNSARIQEAYEHFRSSSLARSSASCLPAEENGTAAAGTKQQSAQYIKPDLALNRYLKLQKEAGDNGTRHREIEELSKQDANCLAIWARPDTQTLDLLVETQNRLSELVGPAEYNAKKATARLVKLMIMFDKVGVAVGFVPAEDSYTHHHLRHQLHTMALATGVSIDTCYTAPLAHVTIGRFIDNAFFEAFDQGGATEEKRNRMERWVNLVQQINEGLQQVHWGDLSWVVGEDKGLEIQLGYIKFGRGTDQADLVGDTLKNRL
ncbi:hypothetical protein BDV12DRAFT_197491 [Aspergillus spectabilis]